MLAWCYENVQKHRQSESFCESFCDSEKWKLKQSYISGIYPLPLLRWPPTIVVDVMRLKMPYYRWL
jgi:hypothetical protein